MDNAIVPVSPERALVAEWKAMLEGTLNEASYTTYAKGIDKFLDWLELRAPTQVSPEVLERWKAELIGNDIKPTSVNTWLSTIRKFFAWAVDKKYLADDPTAGVKNVPRPSANKRHLRQRLTNEEIRAVLAIPDRDTVKGIRDYAILSLKAYTGIRDIEVHRANYEDLRKVKGKQVLMVQPKRHLEKDQPAVITKPPVIVALSDWLVVRGRKKGPLFTSLSPASMGGRLTLSAIRHIVKRYLRLAGIDEESKTSHSFRHSAITTVARKDALKAMQLAGHLDLKTTLIYIHEEDRIEHPGEDLIDYDDDDD